MTAEWFYARDNKRVGPVTEAKLKELARSGELGPSDMVWRQGMAKWVQASQVKGLIESVPGPVPPPLPATSDRVPAASRPAPGELPWPAEERNGFSVMQWVGMGASGLMGFVGLVFVAVSLAQGGDGLCCGPMVFCVTALVLWLGVFNGWMLHGRWVPVDGAGGWVEFLKGGVFKGEDGLAGTFALTRNKRFIDNYVAGRLVDSWKILSWGMSTLEVQNVTGKVRSFKRGKTLEQQQANPFHRDRKDHLPGSWEPLDGSGLWVQFTEDGAFVLSDGSAGRYAVSGEEPNEIIRVRMTDGSTREYRVVSLSKNQLVMAEGAEARTYRRPGTSAARSSGEEIASPATSDEGPGAGSGVGGVLSGLWNWLAGKWPCPQCGSRNTREMRRDVVDRRQEVHTDITVAGHPQVVFTITSYDIDCRCEKCGSEWVQQHTESYRA